MKDRTFLFRGKPFVTITEGTAERDDYVSRLEGRAGLRLAKQLPGESPEDFAQRLLFQLIDADVRFEILGGLLVPKGTADEAWTPEMAAETAGFLRGASQVEDKAAINTQTLALLADFIARGIDWSGTTPIASDPLAPADARPAEIAATANGEG